MGRRKISYAFEQFTGRFQSDTAEEHSDPIEFLGEVVESTSHDHRIEVRDLIAQILSDGSTDLDLAEIWVSGYSDCYVRPDGARAFFQMLLDALNRKLAATE